MQHRKLKTTLVTLATAAVASALAGPAHAAVASPTQATCDHYTWGMAPPRIVIHESEYTADGGSAADLPKIRAAIGDVVGAFNAIGNTSAEVTHVVTTTAPFDYGDETPDDPVPTIHVGWTNNIASLTDDGGGAGAITHPVHDDATCRLTAAYIAFPDAADPVGMTWDYGTPFSTPGSAWYAAGEKDPSGSTWFRPSFLHELLHAWDFHHLHGEYTFMTHRAPGGFPWVNRGEADAVRPLPYEIGVLRKLYPGTDSVYDIFLTNTTNGPPAKATDSADGQHQLCMPSLGASFAADDWASGTCGVQRGTDQAPGSTTTVCAGKTLKTRFTIANPSTDSMNVSAWLTFSRSDTPGASDPESPTPYATQLDAHSSALQQVEWQVPSLGNLHAYRPIVHVVAEHVRSNGSADPDTVRTDWIPLSGTVTCPPTATPAG